MIPIALNSIRWCRNLCKNWRFRHQIEFAKRWNFAEHLRLGTCPTETFYWIEYTDKGIRIYYTNRPETQQNISWMRLQPTTYRVVHFQRYWIQVQTSILVKVHNPKIKEMDETRKLGEFQASVFVSELEKPFCCSDPLVKCLKLCSHIPTTKIQEKVVVRLENVDHYFGIIKDPDGDGWILTALISDT